MDQDGNHAKPRGRAGRPPAADPRLKIYKVRANAEEEAALCAAASAACLPVATYVRQRALGHVKFPIPRTDLQTAAALAKLGNVLNQAVALAHRGMAPDWPTSDFAELQELCGRLSLQLTQTQMTDSRQGEAEPG